MVGADVENGEWAILGAREGLYKTMCTDWDYVNVRDFKYLNNLWESDYKNMTDTQVQLQIHLTGVEIIKNLDLPISREQLNSDQSKFFKSVYQNPARISKAVIDPE